MRAGRARCRLCSAARALLADLHSQLAPPANTSQGNPAVNHRNSQGTNFLESFILLHLIAMMLLLTNVHTYMNGVIHSL